MSRDVDEGPLLGALLRLAHRALLDRVLEGLARGGFADLQSPHMAALRPLWDLPDGARATELARAARITKQSMGVVVDQLEELGYVERIDDPDDRRAKLVRLTKRGLAAGRLIRTVVRGVEADWGRRIGAKRVAALRDTLADLVGSLDADGVP